MSLIKLQDEFNDFKKWVYQVLNGNGRPGLKEQIASIKAWQKIQLILSLAIIGALIKILFS